LEDELIKKYRDFWKIWRNNYKKGHQKFFEMNGDRKFFFTCGHPRTSLAPGIQDPLHANGSITFSRLFFSAWPGSGAPLSKYLEGALYKFLLIDWLMNLGFLASPILTMRHTFYASCFTHTVCPWTSMFVVRHVALGKWRMHCSLLSSMSKKRLEAVRCNCMTWRENYSVSSSPGWPWVGIQGFPTWVECCLHGHQELERWEHRGASGREHWSRAAQATLAGSPSTHLPESKHKIVCPL